MLYLFNSSIPYDVFNVLLAGLTITVPEIPLTDEQKKEIRRAHFCLDSYYFNNANNLKLTIKLDRYLLQSNESIESIAKDYQITP